jgi:aspartate 1-decarboxylase
MLVLLKSKLHCARITEAQLDYEGSLSIDEDLMDLVGIRRFEKVLVSNCENGGRFETYAIPGKRGTGVIGLNGPTSHLGSVGDKVVIMTFCVVPEEQASSHRPLIAVLDEKNQVPAGLKEI